MTDISIHQGSIFDCDVDVIVNPANSFLWNGGGLAGVIQRAATKLRDQDKLTAMNRDQAQSKIDRYEREVKAAKLIPYGGAAFTSAGALPFSGIIHAVGPIWGGGGYHEAAILTSAYNTALSIAEIQGYNSIAFPAISAGIFGCPIEFVARNAVNMCKLTSLQVTFALIEDEHVRAFRTQLFNQGVWSKV